MVQLLRFCIICIWRRIRKINTDDGNDDEQESEQESDGGGYNVEDLLNEFIDVDDVDEEE